MLSTSKDTLSDWKPKKWGKVDKAALHNLINDRLVDINDMSTKSIDSIHAQYFPHREHRNFCCNFRYFATGNALKSEYSGTRRQLGE